MPRKMTRKQVARLGGLATKGITSERKAAASRANGQLGAVHGTKGGKPRSEVGDLAQKLDISRQSAWYRLRKSKTPAK